MSVCPSVRPSVRPSEFSGLFFTCFEISFSNLVYTFSRWHDMSSLSFIIIGSFWPSLQPKVGQTHFLQWWTHKSRWIFQIWYVGSPLYTSRHKFLFFSKILFSEFWRLFLRVFDFFLVFRAFLQHVLRYCFETCYMHLVGGITGRVWVSLQSGLFDLLYSQK